MFNKILIANRGEIACRIIKTARRMGIETVAVYSTADSKSLHVEMADQAFCIGDPQALASYLNIENILDAAKMSGAEAIHPGYGFLSENVTLARACQNAGIVFIGPLIPAMEIMASKQLAKQHLVKAKIPLTPGYHEKDQSDARLLQEAKHLGFPLLLKAAAGGGGKGMRAVYKEAEFSEALAGARREASASFADDTMIIEKLIRHPRHIEIQIMADNHGQVVHLFERDCSIQRRHQKIIEEALAPNLSDTLRHKIATTAVQVAKAIDYRGAGTVEFLLDREEQFYFMEMNTRLQVEHPITEMITNLDLVEWQLKIAANEPLPCTQEQIKAKGHAIECRIYAEDPANDFLPSIGLLHVLKEPSLEGIRIDSGVKEGSSISQYYDPMIAKLIAHGANREEALERLQMALKHYYIAGVKTNIAFLRAVLQNSDFINANFSTHFLNDHAIKPPVPDPYLGLLMAASVDYLALRASIGEGLDQQTFAWQATLDQNERYWFYHYLIEGHYHQVKITPINQESLFVKYDDKSVHLTVHLKDKTLSLDDGQALKTALIESIDKKYFIFTEEGLLTVEHFSWQTMSRQGGRVNTQLVAPMPATVVALLKNKGDSIKSGEGLFVLEAMKMEHTIYAPKDGTLIDVFYEIGAQVNEGALLGQIE